MNIKKVLEKRAKADHQRTLEKNQYFYEDLVKKHYPNRKQETAKKKKQQLWWKLSIATAVTLIVIATILLGIFLPSGDDGPVNTNKYLTENILSKEVPLIELQGDVGDFNLNVYLYYDSISNDDLFYKIHCASTNGLEEWIVEIEVNDDYKLDYKEDNYTDITNINGYSVKYYITNSKENELYSITTNAYFIFNSKKAYIKYECKTLESDDNTFFDWFGNLNFFLEVIFKYLLRSPA